MSSYRQLLYHIVFRTNDSEPTLKRANAEKLDLRRLIDYVKGQQEHHGKKTFEEEYRSLLQESGITIDERYFP